jgi:hypothetical protein
VQFHYFLISHDIRQLIQISFSHLIESMTDGFFSSKSLVNYISLVKPSYFFVYVLVSNYFEISTLDYFSVSTQIQQQNVIWLLKTCWQHGLRCSSAAVSFLGSRVRTLLSVWTFVFCVVLRCVGSGAFFRDISCRISAA